MRSHIAKTLRGDIGKDEINQIHKDYLNPRVKEKLLAIKILYLGYKAPIVAKILGVDRQTIFSQILFIYGISFI